MHCTGRNLSRSSAANLRLCIVCNNATDIKLHVHTYAVGVADIAAHEGSPHNVLHSSSTQAAAAAAAAVAAELCTKHSSMQLNVLPSMCPKLLGSAFDFMHKFIRL